MEIFNKFTFLIVLSTLLLSQVILIDGQISTPCTSSIISSLNPCMGYITGSSRNGASPTSTCCNSLKSMTSTSMDCACLIVTGNVPLPSSVSQALAISLPKACGTSVPLQCKSSGVALPPPGPVLFAPPPPPAAINPADSPVLSPVGSSRLSPTASKVLALLAAPVPSQAPSELLAPTYFVDGDVAPTTTPGIRPVLTPSLSSSRPSHSHSLHFMFTFIGVMVFNYFV